MDVYNCINFAEKFELILAISQFIFLGKLIIENENKATLKAKTGIPHLKLQYDRSKLEKESLKKVKNNSNM